MYSQKIRLLSLNLILVMLLTLMPVQAVENTGTGPGEDKKTEYTVMLNGNGGTLNGEDEVKVTYSSEKLLDFGEYRFTRDGYALIGWSEDGSGNGEVFDHYSGLFAENFGYSTLYAVWLEVPTDSNYAILRTSSGGVIEGAYKSINNFYCVKITDDFTLPVMNVKTDDCYYFWRSNEGGIYYEGEKTKLETGVYLYETTIPVFDGCRSVIIDGNGGSWDDCGKERAKSILTVYSAIGETIGIDFRFTRSGYTLTGYNTQADGKGTAYPIDSITINENMELPVQILYAQWAKEDHLEDNVSLVIGGEDKSDLLDSTTECSGTGWTYQSVDGVSVLHLTKDYNGGSIICKRENVNIVFDDAVSTKRIEVSGALTLTANGDYAKVYESDDTAIRAESVTLAAAAGNYKIVSEKNTAIQAKSLYLNSDDARIEGRPAVPNDTEITCGEKVRIQTNRNSDGTISGLYTSPKSVTLYGNGGKYGEADVVTVDYPDRGSLDLGQYTFKKDGFILTGWAVDKEGTKLATDANGRLHGTYRVLYAVWAAAPNYEKYVLFKTNGCGTIEGATLLADNLYSVELTTDFKMPTLQKNSTVADADLWLWHSSANSSLICYEGEAYTPDSGMEFYISPVVGKNEYHQTIFDGNGGTGTRRTGDGTAYIVNKYGPFNYRDGDTVAGQTFRRPGYILTGYNTQADGTGKAYPTRNIKITADMDPVQILYAQWSPLNLLKNGVRLIIDDDDMTGLLGINGWSGGTSWRFRDNGGNGTADGQIEIRDSTRYSGGSIAFDGNLTLGFVDGASVGQIEAAGGLTLVNNASAGAQFSMKANGVAAIRAERVTTKDSAAVYHISAENAVAVDAATLYLSSPNVTIKGDPAVREGAVIECMKGIGYDITDGGKTLTTYAVEQKVTLNGNGGTLNGKEEMVVTYSPEKPLNLRDYPFAWKGYALVGWATDKEGTKLVTDATGHLKQLDDATLYAVWLEVPDSNYVILLGSYDGAHATKAGYSSIAMAADGTVTLPEVKQNKMGLWRRSDTNEPYFPGETVKVPSGTRFNCVLYYNANKILIFDGNGGTMRDTVNGVQRTVSRWAVSTSVGGTYHSNLQFVRNGYTMTGYNTKKDGSGTAYSYSDIPVTSDMSNQTILYAQWEKITPSGKYITIDGKIYDAMQECRGSGWNYNYHADSDEGTLYLRNYHGGSIASDLSLAVSVFGTNNTVSGSIESKETLQVSVAGQRMNNELTPGNLRVRASEGYALRAGRTMRLEATDGELNISGGENSPALYTQELQISCWENGSFEATGSPNALSYGEIIKDHYQTYLIRGGKDKESAAPITDDTYNNRAYISYEMRDRVLTLHGNGGKTAAGADTFTATSKDNTFDLGEYTNTFTNGDKRLLGWSKTENSATIDYAAASGSMYYFDWSYEFAADLYAVWESDSQRGVVLKNYGYFDGDRYTYSEQYTAVAEGGTYTLPESSRAGYIFKGWLGSDGNSYAAGDTIEIPTALSFTAQYEVGKLTVGGVTYTANRVHGSDALGWMYYPDGYGGYDSGRAQLNLYKNYSGGSITLDGNLTLAVGTDLTGTDNLPAISVTGDMNIRIWGGGTLTPPKPTLTGGENAPAIKVGGTLHLGAPVTLIGGGDAPAMDVGVLDAECAFLAGESQETAKRACTYHNEHYFCMDLAVPTMFQPNDTIPDVPNTETRYFLGWERAEGLYNQPEEKFWYMPGDTINAEETLKARFIPKSEQTVVLDGNGGVTQTGSKYFVILPTGGGLQLFDDTLTNSFRKDGYDLSYNTAADGNGRKFTANELFEHLKFGKLPNVPIQKFFAQWTRRGEQTTDKTAYYTKTDDGAVKIESVDQDRLEEQLASGSTVQIDMSELKAEQVVLPASAVNVVFALPKAEALSIKTANAAVSLDKTAMQSVVETADGNDIQLHVSTGDALSSDQTEIIGDIEQGMVLDVSLTANGTEIHSFDGEVTVSVPFDWTQQGVLQAWYLADDGKTKEPVEVAYRGGTAVLTLEHFSTYAIVVKANDIDETIVSAAGNSVTVNAPAEAASCVAALYSGDGQQMAVGKSEIAENMATVTWKSVDWTKVKILKVFFLDGSGAPIKSSVKALIKVES